MATTNSNTAKRRIVVNKGTAEQDAARMATASMAQAALTQVPVVATTKPIKSGKVSLKDTGVAQVKNGLWQFVGCPTSIKLLRSYFLALILAQLGRIEANKSFVLWSGHFQGHLENGRLVHEHGRNYHLSARGINYFLHDEKQTIHAVYVPEMLDAVTTGKAPSFFNFGMLPLVGAVKAKTITL